MSVQEVKTGSLTATFSDVASCAQSTLSKQGRLQKSRRAAMQFSSVSTSPGGKSLFVTLFVILVLFLCAPSGRGATPPTPTDSRLTKTGPLMILHESLDLLDARVPFGGIYGTQLMLQRMQAQANTSFGHNWAILLNPGDSPDFPTFLGHVKQFESMGVPFVIDIWTSDVEKWSADWAYYNYESVPYSFQPPFTPANTIGVIMLSADQLSQVASVAPTTFVGMRTHEEPMEMGNPALDAVLTWVAGQTRPIYISAPSTWLQSWSPFFSARPNIAVPLAPNNFPNAMDPSWAIEEGLYQQGVVPRIGWSLQTFVITSLTGGQQGIDNTLMPASVYLLSFLYGRAYGGSVFQTEPDEAMFSAEGTLTETGRAVAAFYQAVAGTFSVPAFATSRDTFGFLAFLQDGEVCPSFCGEWMGDSNLAWTSSAASSNEASVTYTTSQMSPDRNALIAIWDPGPWSSPESVLVNGSALTITSTFHDFASAEPGAWYDGANVLYVRTRGNVQVQVTFQVPTGQFIPVVSSLPITRFMNSLVPGVP